MATAQIDTDAKKPSKVGKWVKEGAKQAGPWIILDLLHDNGIISDKVYEGVSNLATIATPAYSYGMEGFNNIVNAAEAAYNGDYGLAKDSAVQALPNLGVAGLAMLNLPIGVTLGGLKFAYDQVQSGKVDDARNLQYISEYNTAVDHLINEAKLLQSQGLTNEQIRQYLVTSVQSQYLNNPLSKDLITVLTGSPEELKNFTLTLPEPNSAYQNIQRSAKTESDTQAPSSELNIVPTASAAELPTNAFLQTNSVAQDTSTPKIQQPVQAATPSGNVYLKNNGNIWTTGDANKASSGVTWSMADPNSDIYKQLKQSADFTNSLNSYKDRTDLSDIQKEQMAIADLMALNNMR